VATTVLDATDAIVAAVYAALNVASITVTLGCAVYDEGVPQAPTFPFLRISDVTATGETLETMSKAADDCLIQVSVFSTYEGGHQARAIRKQVMTLLHNATLTVSGATFVSCRATTRGNGGAEEINGVTVTHKWAQFRVLVRES
jgi:hypothetical protein